MPFPEASGGLYNAEGLTHIGRAQLDGKDVNVFVGFDGEACYAQDVNLDSQRK